MANFSCVILAAGRSSRFPAPQGKLFYPLAGLPIVEHLLRTTQNLHPAQTIIVVNPQNHSQFLEYEKRWGIELAIQNQQDGTWGALQTALSSVQYEQILLLNGDQPLVPEDLLEQLVHCGNNFGLVSTILAQPHGYGRLVRDHCGNWVDLIEEKDLQGEQRQIREVNAGVYWLHTPTLRQTDILPSPHTQERYLTQLWAPGGHIDKTTLVVAQDHRAVQGINTWADFESVEQYYFQQQRAQLAAQGVMLENCAAIIVENAMQIRSEVGSKVTGPAILKGPLHLESLVSIKSFSSVTGAHLGTKTQIGPYAFIQDGVSTESGVQLGAFVEVKRSNLGSGMKAKHLSYIADAHVGANSNIGAFVVFCNYDGVNKHGCTLGQSVFVGSSSQLVAPLTIGDRSYIGAGTTVTHNVGSERLITRRGPWRDRPKNQGEKVCVGSSEVSDLKSEEES